MSTTAKKDPARPAQAKKVIKKVPTAPEDDRSPLYAYWKHLLVATLLALIYKSFSSRAPILLTPPPPSNTNPTCQLYHQPILKFCEDFKQLPDHPNLLVLSCDPGRRAWQHFLGKFPEGTEAGEMWIWDYTRPEMEPVRLGLGDEQEDFHPLGISVVKIPDVEEKEEEAGGFTYRLFVTNQRREKATVEIVDFAVDGRSRHIRSIQSDKIYSPNGIVGYDKTSFFITNDGFLNRRSALGAILELFLGLPFSEVSYITFSDSSSPSSSAEEAEVHATVLSRLASGNGIALDREGKSLYVASMTSGIHQFALSSTTPGESPLPAQRVSFFRTPFFIDNLYISFFPTSPRGKPTLYIGGIPSFTRFSSEMKGEKMNAAAWVISTSLDPAVPNDDEEKKELAGQLANTALRAEEWRFKDVFMDDGGLFGMVSTGAVVDGEARFVGVSVTREGILVCGKEGK